MPQYLGLVRIDWHYDNAPAELKPAIIEANAQLDSTDHTFDTFNEQLAELADEHPTLVADLLIDDGYRNYFLYRLEDGDYRELALDPRLDDGTDAESLPFDAVGEVRLVRDVAGIKALLAEQDDDSTLEDDGTVTLPIMYRDEAALRTIAERVAAAMAPGETSFVADVELQRFFVELAAGRARVRLLVLTSNRALAERLLRGEYTRVPAPKRQPNEKYQLGLFWPDPMLRLIQDEATRTDRSLSWVVQFAWKTARTTISASDRESMALALQTYSGSTRKQTLYFPGDMADEIEACALALDTSQSFVAQTAVALARRDIEAVPTVTEFPGVESE